MKDNAEFSAFAVKIHSRQMTTQFQCLQKESKTQTKSIVRKPIDIDNDVFDAVLFEARVMFQDCKDTGNARFLPVETGVSCALVKSWICRLVDV